MEGVRARRPSYKSQSSMAPKPVREEFKADTEWTEDPSNRCLHVQLPGFRREDIRVQLDSAGKLLIKGSRQVSDNKILDVSLSFDVPKDSIIEKISGKFEDGHLTLTMPKRVVEEQEAKQKPISEEKVKEPDSDEKPKTSEGRKEEEAIKEHAKTGKEEKRDEPMREEKPTSLEEKREERMREEEKPTGLEEMKDGHVREEKTVTAEEKQNELAQRDEPTSSEKYKDEAIQKEKPKITGEKKDDGHALEEKSEKDYKKIEDEIAEKKKPECAEERMKEEQIQTEKAVSNAMEKGKEAIVKVKSKIKEICLDTPKELKKRVSAWRGVEERRLDYGSLDDILEKMNKNRKVIAVAVVAFSAGFYISHKLRTSG